jgi:predicted nucleotidyltransferase
MTKQEIKTKLLEAVQNVPHRDDIKAVALFGSYIGGGACEESDVDVLIDFEPAAVIGFFEFVEIQQYLADALGKTVDLLTPESLSKYFRDEVLRQAELVYEK